MAKGRKNYTPGTGGFMKPDEVLDNLDVQKDMHVADFGCGAGYFTIPLAMRVGKGGVVYAIDVQEGALESVRGRAKMHFLLNIEAIRANLEKEGGSGLKDDSVDMVILANILFQSRYKDAILKEAGRILKKTGTIALVEWQDGASFGPSAAYRVTKDQLKKIAKDAGLVLAKEFNAGSSHYGLVFSL